MKRPSAGIRLGVILLFILGLLSPVATTGAGAQVFTCDDLTAVQAQALLDADPDLAEDLDADGDGEACNETGTTDPVDEGDVDPFVADVQSELDDLGETFDRFLEIDEELGSTTATDAEKTELVAEWNEIAADWVAYPDVAADLGPAPAELADLEDGYLDFADMVGEAGELWETYWAIPADDPEEEAAFDAFNEGFIAAQDELDVVQTLVDDAGGSTTPTDDPTEEPVADDADAYVAAIQDEVDTIDEEAGQLTDLLDLQASGDATNEDGDLFTEIMATWSAYPDDVAADLIAPRGLEDIEDTYLDLADTMAESSLLWDDYLGTEAGSVEEEDAFEALTDSVASVQDQTADVQTLLDEAGGGAVDPNDDPTEEATGDIETYLTDVSTQADEWNDSIDRFNELLGGDLTDADIDEVSTILSDWITAPGVASALEAPAGGEDVQSAFEDYANTVAELGLNFTTYLGAEADTPESEEALDAFTDSIAQAETDYDALQDEITAAS